MDSTTSVQAPTFIFADKYVITDPANADFYRMLMRGMTHKLNNLLAVIQGFSSLIMMNDDLEEGIAENLTHMKDAAVSASALSERVLPAGGCATITLMSLKLNDFLPMVDASLRDPCKKLGVPFQINAPSDIPAINADSGRMKEVIMELLTNAAEAAAATGGEVALDFVNPGQFSNNGTLDILVRNTGSQIDPSKLEEVFKPFYSTKDSSHLGVGLTSAAVLANQMKMRLGINSENNTTTVWLAVPVV